MLPKSLEKELRIIYDSKSVMHKKLILATYAVTNAISTGEVEPRRELRDYLIDIDWVDCEITSRNVQDCEDRTPKMNEADIIEACLDQIYDGIGKLEDLLEIERQTSVYHIPYRRFYHG